MSQETDVREQIVTYKVGPNLNVAPFSLALGQQFHFLAVTEEAGGVRHGEEALYLRACLVFLCS